MLRFGGAMWGAFWGTRILLLLTDPLFIHLPSIAFLTSVAWASPLGMFIVEVGHKRLDSKVAID